MNIQGKTILLTGGAIRIGRIIAKSLAKRGARIAIHYHTSKDNAQALERELASLTETQIFQANFENFGELIRLVPEIEEKFGLIDVLINSAAIFEEKQIFSIQEKDWNRQININLRAPFFLSQQVSFSMLKRKSGKIISIIDYSPNRPPIDYLVYSVSKAGLKTLTKALAKELAPYVTVNAIALGPTLPPESYSEEKKKQVAEKTLLKRWGDPQEVANAVLFLIEGNDNATGGVLHLDGLSYWPEKCFKMDTACIIL